MGLGRSFGIIKNQMPTKIARGNLKFRKWSENDIEILKKIYNQYLLEELSNIFRRSKSKICRKARDLGLFVSKSERTRRSKIAINRAYSSGNKIIYRGENSQFWKGGKFKRKDGYIFIFIPNHPNSNKDGYVLEHRLIIEKMIGRYLKKQEVVHHRNRINCDNRPENLCLFKSQKEHASYHKKNDEQN